MTIILAYFNLVFGELVPKRIALQKAQGFSLFCVRPIYYISRIMNPFIKLLSLSTSGFLKLIGMHNENLETDVSEEEIKSMLETGSETGVFNDIEKEMITSIFSFDELMNMNYLIIFNSCQKVLYPLPKLQISQFVTIRLYRQSAPKKERIFAQVKASAIQLCLM